MIRLLAVVLAFLASCASTSNGDSAADPGTAEPGVDRIVVTYSPSGRIDSDDVQTVTIVEPEQIARWVAALAAVPDEPEKGIRYIRFLPNAPEHRVEFFSGDSVVVSKRMKGGQLDVDSHPGWAFYSGEDVAFTALVTEVAPMNWPAD